MDNYTEVDTSSVLTGMDYSAQEMDIDTGALVKRQRNFDNGSSMGGEVEEGGSAGTSSEVVKEPENTNYHKFTISKLKQKMTEAGFGAEILQARNPSKKDLVALYERLILHKPAPQ